MLPRARLKRMAFVVRREWRFAFFALLLLPYQCEAKAENYSETQCPLLPVEDDLVASGFRFKASEKGFRLVYINLVNGSPHKQFFLDKILASFYYSCG